MKMSVSYKKRRKDLGLLLHGLLWNNLTNDHHKIIKWNFKKVAVPTGYQQELILMEMSLKSLHAVRHKQKTMVLISDGWTRRAGGHVPVFQMRSHMLGKI